MDLGLGRQDPPSIAPSSSTLKFWNKNVKLQRDFVIIWIQILNLKHVGIFGKRFCEIFGVFWPRTTLYPSCHPFLFPQPLFFPFSLAVRPSLPFSSLRPSLLRPPQPFKPLGLPQSLISALRYLLFSLHCLSFSCGSPSPPLPSFPQPCPGFCCLIPAYREP